MDNIITCRVCGKKFKACNSCMKGVDEELQWKKVVCCREHFAYHIPIIMYHRGKMSKEEAREKLTQAIKTYGEVDFVDNVKPIVDEILAEPKVEIKKEKKTVKKVPVEDTVIDDVSNSADE